jgi:hypothetical protein
MKKLQIESTDEVLYLQIREILIESRKKVYNTANNIMVDAYWKIGKKII